MENHQIKRSATNPEIRIIFPYSVSGANPTKVFYALGCFRPDLFQRTYQNSVQNTDKHITLTRRKREVKSTNTVPTGIEQSGTRYRSKVPKFYKLNTGFPQKRRTKEAVVIFIPVTNL